MNFTDNELAEMMHKAGVRPSVQRIAILSSVFNTRKHPSADDIFSELSPRYPSLSRTTVYNSLHALCERGVVRPGRRTERGGRLSRRLLRGLCRRLLQGHLPRMQAIINHIINLQI